MSIVWHRLGREHLLVQELDRISREQSRNLIARKRIERSSEAVPVLLCEYETERAELDRQRRTIEAKVQFAIAQLKQHSSDATKTARSHLANVLAQGYRSRTEQDSAAG